MLERSILHGLRSKIYSIVLLFILLDCVTNEKPPCAKGCHVPLTAFYRPVKALLNKQDKSSLNSHIPESTSQL